MGSLSRDELLEMYRHLHLTRELEERLEGLARQGRLVGNLYRSLGQEATAVGSAFALRDGDWICPGIRDLGALFVRGLEPEEMLLQYLARAEGHTRGKDTTTHFNLPGLGILGPISPLGEQLCVLNGYALAFQKRGEDRVCMAYQGEGATRTGASHEGLNFAAVRRLPMVVVLEHNRWSFSTPSDREAAVEEWTDVAKAYGLPVRHVDGNDVLEVYDAAEGLVERARSGEGAGMVVAETYRMKGHAQHDPQPYVPEGELEEWHRRDPIPRFRRYLLDQDFASAGSLEAVEEEVGQRLDRAVDEALESPFPDPEEAREGVYAERADEEAGGVRELPASRPWTRREVVGYPDLPSDVTPARVGEEE